MHKMVCMQPYSICLSFTLSLSLSVFPPLYASLFHWVGVLVLCNILVLHQWKKNNRHSPKVLAFCKQHAHTHTLTLTCKRLFVVCAIISMFHASLKTAFGTVAFRTLARFTAHLTEFSTAICARTECRLCVLALFDVIDEMWVFLSWVQRFG